VQESYRCSSITTTVGLSLKLFFFAIKYTVINLIGLRAIKSVLDCAIKQRFSAKGESEETIIYKAIQSVSSAKYMSQDLLIYNVRLQII
jgi:Hydrolytic ATP binding site of dynein motor region